MPDPVTIGHAAVGWGLSMAGWPLSAKISKWIKLLSNGSSATWDKLMDLEGKIKNLKRMLDDVQGNPGWEQKLTCIKEIIRKLKAAMYKAEDIIDSIDYLCLETSRLETSTKGKSAKTVSPHNTSTFQNTGITKEFSVPTSIEVELSETLEEIQKLIEEVQKNLGERGTQSSPTVSTPPEVVFGREDDLAKIQKMLRDLPAADEEGSSTTKCYSVIGIHGIPGSGKTTLAQHVSKTEEEMNDRYFDLFMWIHVSQEFSMEKILAELLEAASEGQKVRHSNNSDTECKNLKEKLKDKKFFLVLDDVWNDKTVDGQKKLDVLLGALNAGSRGSKILVTTRDEEAATAFGAETETLIKISDLEDEQYFKMFMHYALSNTSKNSDDRGSYERIGREIAAKLKHSPLAARIVAGQLRGTHIDDWERALRSDLLKSIIGVLWWSYRQLDEHASQCFAYCSMFPRGYLFKRDELVHQWMAQGFLTTIDETRDMEDIGNGYFNVLLSCSFIQPDGDIIWGRFIVHDLVHDLAERVAGDECFRIEKGKVPHIPDPRNVRHLFIESFDQNVFTKEVLKLVGLRTIFVNDSVKNITDGDWDKLFMNQKKLRAVHMPVSEGIMVPREIGELEHLRYLSFWSCYYDIDEDMDIDKDMDVASEKEVIDGIILPSTFGKLYRLQKLSAPDFEVDFSKVKEMCNLVNLHYINIGTSTLNFPDIGRLTLLRNPGVFTVRKERGYEIHQLEKLNNIRDCLYVEGLENVENKEHAVLADLANKKYISRLKLDWKNSDPIYEYNEGDQKSKKAHRDSDPQEEILEALCPPSQITDLEISHYNGSKYPSWLSVEQCAIKYLESLFFQYCNRMEAPPTISIFKYLRTLRVHGCSWHSLPADMEHLTSLQSLSIEDCKKMLSLPKLPSTINKLQLKKWNGQDLPPAITEWLVNMHMLDLWDCSFPSLPQDMHRLRSLKNLTLGRCKDIMSLPTLPSSLEELHLEYCNPSLEDHSMEHPILKNIVSIKPSRDKEDMNTWSEES